MEYSHVRQQTPRFPGSTPHPPVYPQRAIPRPAQSSPTNRRIPQREIERRIDALQAWEARKLLKIEQLRVALETQELQKAPFKPTVSAKSIEIVKALDARRAESTEGRGERIVGTTYCGSPCSARRKQRSESALKAASPRAKATVRQRFSPLKGSDAPTETPHLSSAETDSQADSSKTTAKAESVGDWNAAERKATVTYRALSPVVREVRFAAGLDLAGFYQRATPVGRDRPPLPT